MKTVSVREIDELGRIVIPKAIRQALKIETGDRLEIIVDGKEIIIRMEEAQNATVK